MLKDITLGQYFPADSPIHRLDARVKILLTFIYIGVIFFITNLWGYLVLFIAAVIIIRLSQVPLIFFVRSLKPLLFFIAITAVINVFLTTGTPLWSWGSLTITYEGVYYAIFMMLRITFLIIGSSVLTYTTSPIMLTNGIEFLLKPFAKFKLPAHEIAMMMTIALRFIPTLLEETDKIMKAQLARGADFESGNIIRRAKAMVPLLVPLFVSAFRRADDLAIAMESRCYTGGEGRTSLHQPKVTMPDYVAVAFIAVMILGIILIGNL